MYYVCIAFHMKVRYSVHSDLYKDTCVCTLNHACIYTCTPSFTIVVTVYTVHMSDE